MVRSGKVLELAYTLQQSRPLVPALHGVECVPSYFIVAGLVFVPLSIPFLEHAYGSKLSPLPLLLISTAMTCIGSLDHCRAFFVSYTLWQLLDDLCTLVGVHA